MSDVPPLPRQRGDNDPTAAAADHADLALIEAARGGDVEATAALFRRHHPAAVRFARMLAGSAEDAEDVAAEGFARVLTALKAGKGPNLAFRPYLLTTVKRVYLEQQAGMARESPVEELEPYLGPDKNADRTGESFAADAAIRAFSSLPQRWQEVLWHTEVEGEKPAILAATLGMSARSVSALAFRAREGLRQAWLQAHIAEAVPEACQGARQHLGAYVRNGLGPRQEAVVRRHLDECGQCTAIYLELAGENNWLPAIVAPALLGTAALTAYLKASGIILGGSLLGAGGVAGGTAGAGGAAAAGTAGAAAAGVGGATAGAGAGVGGAAGLGVSAASAATMAGSFAGVAATAGRVMVTAAQVISGGRGIATVAGVVVAAVATAVTFNVVPNTADRPTATGNNPPGITSQQLQGRNPAGPLVPATPTATPTPMPTAQPTPLAGAVPTPGATPTPAPTVGAGPTAPLPTAAPLPTDPTEQPGTPLPPATPTPAPDPSSGPTPQPTPQPSPDPTTPAPTDPLPTDPPPATDPPSTPLPSPPPPSTDPPGTAAPPSTDPATPDPLPPEPTAQPTPSADPSSPSDPVTPEASFSVGLPDDQVAPGSSAVMQIATTADQAVGATLRLSADDGVRATCLDCAGPDAADVTVPAAETLTVHVLVANSSAVARQVRVSVVGADPGVFVPAWSGALQVAPGGVSLRPVHDQVSDRTFRLKIRNDTGLAVGVATVSFDASAPITVACADSSTSADRTCPDVPIGVGRQSLIPVTIGHQEAGPVTVQATVTTAPGDQPPAVVTFDVSPAGGPIGPEHGHAHDRGS